MEIDEMISAYLLGIEGQPDYARNLVVLAELVSRKREISRV